MNRSVFEFALAAARALPGRGPSAASGGAWGPGVLRALAILQVFLQGCADKLTNQTGPEGQEQPSAPAGPADAPATPPIAAPRPAPAVVDASTFPAALLADLQGHYERQGPRGTWRILTGRLAAGRHAPIEWSSMIDGARVLGRGEPGGEALSRRLVDHFERRSRGEPETVDELDALLAAAEAWPLYDDAFAGYVWLQAMQAGGEPGELAALLARIERHLRVTHALLRASAETGRVEFSAWRSKAAPPREWKDVRVPAGLGEAAARLYPETDADTWASEGTIALVVEGDRPVVLRRAGQAIAQVPGAALTLRRLDLLEVDLVGEARLRAPIVGELRLPAGARVSAWGIAAGLGDEAEARVRARVDAAIAGDEAAMEQLQAILPAAHGVIREALARDGLPPAARGRLEMLLVIFEE